MNDPSQNPLAEDLDHILTHTRDLVLNWAKRHSIIGLGRWGTWEYMNSDVAVSHAIAEAKKLTEG